MSLTRVFERISISERTSLGPFGGSSRTYLSQRQTDNLQGPIIIEMR